MSKIAADVTELIGGTPLVKINKLSAGLPGTVVAKLESNNPGFSVKDRIANAMITAALESGELKEGMTVIEPTSGNTGIGLALVCAAKGLKLVLTMPDTMSGERRQILRVFGASLELTPGSQGMPGAINRAKEMLGEIDNSWMPQQFENSNNPKVHEETTAQEIWNDTDGKVDILISGVGTGGTLTGCGTALKAKNASVKIIAVEPVDSPVLSGGTPGPHKIQGIGAGFIPAIMNTDLIDGIEKVSNEDSGETARQLAQQEGIFCGISSGAAMKAALNQAAKPENKDKLIVVILPDTGERYLSTWLFDMYKC